MSCDFTPQSACYDGLLGPSLTDACPGSNVFVFMSLLNALVLKNNKISGRCDRIIPVKRPDYEYDFIIIGGGAAGSVVAGRLSEICHWKVLLIERGFDEPPGAEVPGFVARFLKTNDMWNYTTTNESHACLSTNGSCAWPSGKNLGGNTVHNGMVYLRGNPTDYNRWAAAGNEGWSWDEVEPFFIKSEDNREIKRVGRKHHGTGGPLPVQRFPYKPRIAEAILKAADQIGLGVSEDLNGDTKTGLSIIQATNKNGIRYSSSRAFLWPIRNRKNLHISLGSYATKLIIKNGRAIGVEYHKNGKLRTVYVTKEIIVSGGVIQSPQLLLLSGIGPRDHLESMGVKVVLDLPGVGENLHDHPSAIIPFTMNEPDTYDNDWNVAADYLTSQTGPLSSNGMVQVVAMIASNMTKSDFPDGQVFFNGYFDNCAPGPVGALASTGKRTLTPLPTNIHPKSRGRITLKSNDPFEYPSIWANYLGDPEDVERMVAIIRITLKLLKAEALSSYNLTLANKPLEACANYKFDSDEYWACVARQQNFALYHQGGTCKMGPSSDNMAVVDPQLRVHGIKGLRVADTSIMPQIPSCNTAAPTIMIGERCAHFIKETWNHESGLGTCTHEEY